MELFAKRMTWELDNEEGLSCLSFELEDGYFTLSRKTGAETLRLEMNDPANGQLIDPDCFEYALDNTCLLYTSPSPRDAHESRMPSSA